MERSVLHFDRMPPTYKVAFGRNEWLCLYKRHRRGHTYYTVHVNSRKFGLELRF